uniref:BZIP domain-containing protein n=1 Tax=Globisporangium ultimum (strain ATCC 200006 / CBS 805.95 / DAOM BR144) TaxID=431595 RepID=K3WXB8_GLOUD
MADAAHTPPTAVSMALPQSAGGTRSVPDSVDAVLDDELLLNHWIVDICEQLGADDDTADAAVKPFEAHAGPIAPIYAPQIDSNLSSTASSPSSDSSATASAYAEATDTRPLIKPLPHAVGSRRRVAKKPVASRRSSPDEHQEELLLGAGDASAETRREKNRLRVRRHYYRKLTQMNELRTQVSALEDKIRELQLSNASASSGAHGSVVVKKASFRQQQQLEQYLRELETAKTSLLQENQHVRSILHEQAQQFMAIRNRLIDEFKYLPSPFPMPFIVKRKLAPAECDRIWQTTKHGLRDVLRHTQGLVSVDNISGDGGAVCGWHTTRVVEDGSFKFVFQKMLYNRTAEKMRDAAWRVLSDPAGFTKLYPPSVKMWISLVQTVDNDNVVLFQEHRSMDKDNVLAFMKTILLASRVTMQKTHGDGANLDEFSITLRGLEHEQLMLEDLVVSCHEVWNDINTWLQWIPRGEHGEHCELKVSGAIPTVGSNSYFWVVEVLLIVMRLEAATTAEQLLEVPCE